jgi:hypothetical protein
MTNKKKQDEQVEKEVPLEDEKVIMKANSGPKLAPNPDDVPVIRSKADPFRDQKIKPKTQKSEEEE